MFAVGGDGFRYAAKAIVGCYPRYWELLPIAQGNDVRFTLTPEGAQRLREHVGNGTGGVFARLTVHRDRIELADVADLSRRSVFAATSDSAGLPCGVELNTCYLRQFLKMGFLTMSLSSRSQNPLASSEGTGVYLFMPRGEKKENAEATAAESETKPQSVKTDVQTNCQEGNCTQTNNQPKEKPTMTQAISPITVARPVPTAVPQASVTKNPLDETLACIAAMREQLSALEARLLDAGRGIKAALVEQRLKERQYADAKRKLERVRLAV